MEGTALRALRNHLVLVVADETRKEAMRRNVRRRLALRVLKRPERLADLAEHQQAKVHQLEAASEKDLAISIQQCYRHVFYPSRNRIGAGTVDLAHTAMELPSVSATPGSGQQQIVRGLRDLNKLRLGPVSDAQPVREFLEPQLRAARSSTLTVDFQLTFGDGLTIQGDAAEKLTERLAKFTSGVAHVSATPKGETQ